MGWIHGLRTTDEDGYEDRTRFHLEVTSGVGDDSLLLWNVTNDGRNPVDGNVGGYFLDRILVTRPADLNQDFSVDFSDCLRRPGIMGVVTSDCGAEI